MDIETSVQNERTNITLGQLDRVVQKPETIQRFLEENPTVGVNQVFNVTPHSVEGMDWTSSLLQRACSKHHVDSVQWLLENGADPNLFRDAVEDINSIPPITLCLLHAVTALKRELALKNMRMLVAHGAHLNKETECSSFPIECAAAVVTDRSPESAWKLAQFLVEHGALTRNLTPNLFSAPPAKLVQQLKDAECVRNETMTSLLTFALQCTEIPRSNETVQQDTTISPMSTINKRPMKSPFSPFSPFSQFSAKSPRTPGGCSSVGPFSQLGLSQPLPPSTPPTTPHARTLTLPPTSYTYTTPTTSTTNFSRSRTYAQMAPPPRAPFSKLKASGLKRSRSRRNSSEMDVDTCTHQVSQVLEFATPTRTVSKRTRSISLSSDFNCQTPLKKRRTTPKSNNQKPSNSYKLSAKIHIPTDVQRVILDFAMPVLHSATRKQRINSMLQMKTERARGAALTKTSFSTKQQ